MVSSPSWSSSSSSSPVMICELNWLHARHILIYTHIYMKLLVNSTQTIRSGIIIGNWLFCMSQKSGSRQTGFLPTVKRQTHGKRLFAMSLESDSRQIAHFAVSWPRAHGNSLFAVSRPSNGLTSKSNLREIQLKSNYKHISSSSNLILIIRLTSKCILFNPASSSAC